MLSDPPPSQPARPWTGLLGTDPLVREQVVTTLISLASYLLYGVIVHIQVRSGLMPQPVAQVLGVVALGANLAFYGLVRSGRVARGRDPGLARTQLLFGVALMFPSYASIGPAAGGLLVVMASHIVYAMFMMSPRQVWRLVAGTLLALAGTVWFCHAHWPERYETRVQVSNLLYALLVMPLIALLAFRITHMTTRLRQQQLQLQTALARLQELATRDELTRTHNRRHMTELMVAQRSQHQRLGHPLSLALIDIDLFKAVNDQHGHAVGDEVLRQFATVAQESLRAHDQLGRWGGEEFLVMMPHSTAQDAQAVMARLKQRLADTTTTRLPAHLSVTFSAGIAEIQPDEPLEHAIDRADQAMYRAKAQGRNRCEVAG